VTNRSDTARRKDQHLDLCAEEQVEPAETSTLLDCVGLVHCAMPERALVDIRLDTRLFGRPMRAPVVISGMSGGTARGARLNRELAAVAEAAGVAFGVGSQRAMVEDVARSASYQVRDVAPSIPLIGNIGLRQADALTPDGVARLRDAIKVDAMALHLNVAQELTQPEGDRDFRGGYALVERLVAVLDGAVLVKETGCGIGPDVARRLAGCGVEVVDVSGAGGTSWVRVEQLRSSPAGRTGPAGRATTADLAGWGIPTAAATLCCRDALGPDAVLIASGGIRTGLDAARAFALGADLVGVALPVLRAWHDGGPDAAAAALQQLIDDIRRVVLLVGVEQPAELRAAAKVLAPPLLRWRDALRTRP
jgi:isopentenyl-diphosphate delta-isomerase